MSVEVRALLMCDLAFQQAGTGAWHIIGVYDRVFVRELPATHAPMVAFWSLKGFSGDAMVMLTIRDNVGDVVHALRAMIPKLPGDALEHAFAFPPILFKKDGSHVLELHVADRLLALRSFHVQIVAPPKPV